MNLNTKQKPLTGGKVVTAGEHGMNVTAGVTIDYTSVPINGQLKRIIESGTAIVKNPAKKKYVPYQSTKITEKFDGDGTAKKFTLTTAVNPLDNVEVKVEGQTKSRDIDFILSRSVSGGKYVTDVELAVAPPTGVQNVEIIVTPLPVEPLITLHTEDCTLTDVSVAATHHQKVYEASCIGVDEYFKRHTPMIVYLRADVNGIA